MTTDFAQVQACFKEKKEKLSSKRAVLVICENISDINVIEKACKGHFSARFDAPTGLECTPCGIGYCYLEPRHQYGGGGGSTRCKEAQRKAVLSRKLNKRFRVQLSGTTTPYEFARNLRAMEGSNKTPYEPPSNLGTMEGSRYSRMQFLQNQSLICGTLQSTLQIGRHQHVHRRHGSLGSDPKELGQHISIADISSVCRHIGRQMDSRARRCY